MAPQRSQTETEDQPKPMSVPLSRGQEVLIEVFPGLQALPLPSAREPVGRSWFASSGREDRRISEHHLVFSRPGGQRFVEDVGSRNGTWLNGARLGAGERTPLVDGSLLRIGSTLLVYREMLAGGLAPSVPLGRMVGPYGLRGVESAVEVLRRTKQGNVLLEGESGTGKELAAELIATRRNAREIAPISGEPRGLSGVRCGSWGLLR